MSIDLKFVELTADVLEIFFMKKNKKIESRFPALFVNLGTFSEKCDSRILDRPHSSNSHGLLATPL